MLLREPPTSRWDLRARLWGAEIRIRPIFWASSVLVGIIFYRDPEAGGVSMFGLWLSAVVLSFLAHEAGHLLVARLLKVPTHIVLSGLGGHVFGLEQTNRWRRVLILLAGPLASFLVLAVLWGVTALPLAQKWRDALAPIVSLLMWINAFWALINVLPVWPFDGGRITLEIGDALFGSRGQTAALLVSLVVIMMMSLTAAWWGLIVLANRFDPRYMLYLIFLGVQLLYCYVLWLCTFRALWGNDAPHDELSRPGRAA
jgi:stage IV sporulation protein FB